MYAKQEDESGKGRDTDDVVLEHVLNHVRTSPRLMSMLDSRNASFRNHGNSFCSLSVSRYTSSSPI